MLVAAWTRTDGILVECLSFLLRKDERFLGLISGKDLFSCRGKISVICSWADRLIVFGSSLWALRKLMSGNRIVFCSFAVSIHVYLLNEIWIGKKVQVPGPGVMV